MIPIWTPPVDFILTNPYSTSLSTFLYLNTQLTDRLYLLDKSACTITPTVRQTTNDIPQANGSILHHRFLTGVQVQLKIDLWQTKAKPACDDLLADMVDELMGAFASLLNAGDNEGRLAWEVPGKNERILDDVRLLVYPTLVVNEIFSSVTVTIDTKYPYAQDLTQIRTPIDDGSTVTISNTGTSEYFPVFQVNKLNDVIQGGTAAFTIDNAANGKQFAWDASQPGGSAIGGADYGEIDCFGNTMYLNGNGANLTPGIVMLSSEYFPLEIGDNDITINGAATDVLWAPAWA